MSKPFTQMRAIPLTRRDMIVTKWGARFHGRRFPCAVGRGGIQANKVEGDGVSPIGIWHLVSGGYRPDRAIKPRSGITMTPLLPFDIWSDDVADPEYNHGLRAKNHPYSHESLRRADPLYDIVLASDWNWPKAIPGNGSAIFVHNWRAPRFPTAGCIAFDPKDLRWILTRWTPASRIFVR